VTPPPSLGGHRPALGLLARISHGETTFFPRDGSPDALGEHADLTLVLERLASWRLVILTPRPVAGAGLEAVGVAAELTDRGRLYASLLPTVSVLTDPEGRRWAYWEEDPRSDPATAGERIVVFCSGATVRTTRGPAGVTSEPEAIAHLWSDVA
jgi:hypothetical protein